MSNEMGSPIFKDSHQINSYISIRIPTVGEIIDNEDAYFDAVCDIVSTPYDLMVQLDDIGIDFTKISEFELFCLLFKRLQESDTSLIFGDWDISGYTTAVNKQTGEMVLWDPKTDTIIDRVLHDNMASFLRKILCLEKITKTPANPEAHKYMLQRARAKLKSAARRRKQTSNLEEYIVALVNCENFKYNFRTVRNLTIYQFYLSLQQIAHKIKFDNTMIGCYAGTIKPSELSNKDQTWIMSF